MRTLVAANDDQAASEPRDRQRAFVGRFVPFHGQSLVWPSPAAKVDPNAVSNLGLPLQTLHSDWRAQAGSRRVGCRRKATSLRPSSGGGGRCFARVKAKRAERSRRLWRHRPANMLRASHYLVPPRIDRINSSTIALSASATLVSRQTARQSICRLLR